MMKKLKLIIPLFVYAFFIDMAFAQNNEGSDSKNVSTTEVEKVQYGPSSTILMGSPQVTVEAGQANNKAQIVVGFPQEFKLSLTAPLDKEADYTDFASLGGLPDNLKLTGNWSSMIFGKINTLDRANQRDRVCNKYGLGKSCLITELEDSLKARGIAEYIIHKVRLEYDKASFDSKWVWLVNLIGNVGHKEFEFFNTSSAEEVWNRFSVSGGIGFTGIYGHGYLAFGLEIEHAYKAQTVKAQKCEAVVNQTDLSSCKELPLGEPDAVTSPIGKIEVKHIFGKLAITPAVEYNFDKNVVGAQLPIYFLQNTAGQLTGGFRGSWRSDVKEIGISVFISKPISL